MKKPDFELNFCENCFQMTNHLNGICQKCKDKPKENKEGERNE